MPCDTIPFRQSQTLTERKEEVKGVVSDLDKMLQKKKVKPVVGKQGAITFDGWAAADRRGVSDACAYRMLMTKGSQLAKLELMKAEQLAGRSVSKEALAQGIHSHDGGKTWGSH